MKMNFPQATNDTHRFSKAIAELASEARNLQQIVSLQQAAKMDDRYQKDLEDLEASIHSVEEKVKAMKYMTAQERTALKTLETLYHQSLEQNKLYKEMIRNVQDAAHESVGRRLSLSMPSTPISERSTGKENKSNIDLQQYFLNPTFPATPKQEHPESSRERSQNEANTLPSIPFLPRTPLTPLTNKFKDTWVASVPITEMEFSTIPKAIRGRITRSVVNDSLNEIENVVWTKYSVLQGQQSRHLFRLFWIRHKEMQNDEHGDHPWVSEQDLRSNCTFFRLGESTARSILAMLCSLRRLKQVPARKLQVTYILLQSLEDSGGNKEA
jgi:Spindle and kinetochore-associated protein 1